MVDVELELEVDANITQKELNIRLQILGELIINEVKTMIRSMDLLDTGQFLQGWLSSVENGRLIIENTTEYATYLEYGTYEYWQIHGLESFTDPSDPKKKNLTQKQKAAFPKGMQAFAPVRRVVFNKNIMEKLLNEAFS